MVKAKTIGGLKVNVREVMVEAVKRATFASRIGPIHVDPAKNAHPRARKRELPEDVALAMRDKGLVKILRQRVVVEGEESGEGDEDGGEGDARGADVPPDEDGGEGEGAGESAPTETQFQPARQPRRARKPAGS